MFVIECWGSQIVKGVLHTKLVHLTTIDQNMKRKISLFELCHKFSDWWQSWQVQFYEFNFKIRKFQSKISKLITRNWKYHGDHASQDCVPFAFGISFFIFSIAKFAETLDLQASCEIKFCI